jgi:hypothetical protein
VASTHLATARRGSRRERSLGLLEDEADVEERKFNRGETSDQTAGLELFRRAIAERDGDAWQAIIAVYRGVLIGQAKRHRLSPLVDAQAGLCVDLAFERFWHATRAGRLQQFDSLAPILRYLKLCFASVLLDEARARRRRTPEVPLEELSVDGCLTPDASADVIDQVAATELWQAIRRQLATEEERLVAYLSFVEGLTPAEIVERHADRFPTAPRVYRIKRGVVERLRSSPVIQRLRSNTV